jgi:hypothetical protein
MPTLSSDEAEEGGKEDDNALHTRVERVGYIYICMYMYMYIYIYIY